MENKQSFTDVTQAELIRLAGEYNQSGYRLAQICATQKNDKVDILYSFTREGELINLRMPLDDGQIVESISKIYSYSYLYENEISELFGVNIPDKNVDFKGHFYKIASPTPFANKPEQEV